MGGAASVSLPSPTEKYAIVVPPENNKSDKLFDKDEIVNNHPTQLEGNIEEEEEEEEEEEAEVEEKLENSESHVKPLLHSSNSMGLDKLMTRMKFYQNLETSEVIFILGSDRIEDVLKLEKDEWLEVNVSGLQDDYIRHTMQSKTLAQRQFFNDETLEATASVSEHTDTDTPVVVSGSRDEHDEPLSHDEQDDEHNGGERLNRVHDDEDLVEAFLSPVSERSPGSSVGSDSAANKVKAPSECPYCDYTFSRLENKNHHIASCRYADEHDAKTIKEWVDLISQSNQDVMSEAITEAVRQFEEKVYHRKTVLLLLKQLRLYCKKGTVEQLQALCAELTEEREEIRRFIQPERSSSTNKSEFITKRNEELRRMLNYLKKGTTILKRKIASKNCFHIEDFTVGNVLSTGSFSTVHLAKYKATGQLFALKVMKREFLREQKMEYQIERECRVMEHTSLFPDIFLRLYFHDTRVNHICILMEYVPTGDCLQLMKSMQGSLSLELAKHVIANLIVAVSFLHSHGVVHRDIKPDNLLMTPQGHVKLVDFGMSSHHPCNTADAVDEQSMWLEEMHNASSNASAVHPVKSETDLSLSSFRFGDRCDEDLMKTLVGNVNYAAPEVLQGEGYDHSIDWWAVGVLYFHFIAGVPPFYAPADSETKFNVIEGHINWTKVPANTPASCRAFIAALLERKPKQRLGAKGGKEVETHEHFQGLDFGLVLQTPGPFLPTEVEVDFKAIMEVDFLD